MRSREHYEAAKAKKEAREQNQQEIAAQREREAALANVRFWRHPDRIIRYTGWLQAYTFILAIGTILLFAATVISARILSSTDNSIRGQLNEMRSEQRPWIALAYPASVTGKIYWNDTIGFVLTMENVGKYPTDFFAADSYIVDGEYKWIDTAHSICQTLDKLGRNPLSAVPNAPWPIPSEQMPSVINGMLSYGDELRRMNDPFLAGCAIYTYANSNRIHQTPFGAHLVISKDGKITTDRTYAADAD